MGEVGMGRYEKLKMLSSQHFRRLTGVKRETFEKMASVLVEKQKSRDIEGLEERVGSVLRTNC